MTCDTLQLSSFQFLSTQIGQVKDWVFISANTYFSFAIKKDGTLWAWGINGKAQLGDTLVYFRNTPTQVGTASNWKTINGCDEAAVALKTDGTIWA